MIDKKIEQDIKAVANFLEFWGRFHAIYNGIVSKSTITKEDEEKFLETKAMMAGKYAELNKALELKYAPHSRLTDPVSDVLGLASIRFVSEKNLKKAEDDWKDSFIFLNGILERLKNNKKRMGEFNPVGVFLKRLFDRKEVKS